MKVLLFANTDWYLYNFRLPLAKNLRALGAEVVFVSPAGSYGARLRDAGFRWIPVAMERRSLNPVRELLLSWRLAQIYRREKPDLAHHFTIKCVVYGSLAAIVAGVQCRVNAITGMGYVFSSTSFRARALRPFLRAMMKLSLGGRRARVILQNRDDYRAFETASLVHPSFLRLIRGSGVDTQRFRPNTTSKRDENRFTLIFAARLLWDKGIGEYVEASRRLRERGYSFEFLVAGAPDDGNPNSVPSDTVQEWHRKGLITALGHVEDMPYLMAKADAAVLPSFYGEGVPRSLIEAAAAGLPLISTDAPGCREIVQDGINGLLVPPKDPGALASAILWLYQHPADCTRMGKAGREKVLREFDERIVIDQTLDVYREILPGGLVVPSVDNTAEQEDVAAETVGDELEAARRS